MSKTEQNTVQNGVIYGEVRCILENYVITATLNVSFKYFRVIYKSMTNAKYLIKCLSVYARLNTTNNNLICEFNVLK